MSRLPHVIVALAALVLLAGCSAQAGPVAPSRAPTQAEPYRVTRADALAALRATKPRGFTRPLTCRSRKPEPCRRPGTERSSWFVATQDQGADLPQGNGLGEFVRSIVTGWPSEAAASSYADRLTRRLGRYDGDYDILLERTGPRRYVPADRGQGELHEVTFAGWRGTMLRRVFHYVFYDLSPSGTVLGGHAVLSRGRYVLDLEWVARNQRTDRRLSQLAKRLLQRLR